MKFDIEINLEDLGLDGISIAQIIAEEIRAQIVKKVREAAKADPKVDALVKKMKEATIQRLLDSMEVKP